MEQVGEILDEYREFLPLTNRQIFYRMVGAYGYPKHPVPGCGRPYNALCEHLVRARRAGMIPFDAIRDDGATESAPVAWGGLGDLHAAWRESARRYRRDRQEGQPERLEVWCEAAGMVPQLARVAHEYGVPVFSSGGFDSLTAKYDAAVRSVNADAPTVVLHVGDHDLSGRHIFRAAAEDVAALATGIDPGLLPPEFVRVAVTAEQVALYGLETREDDHAVQAEALAPDQLATELLMAIMARQDVDARARVTTLEAKERAEAILSLDDL